MTLEGRFVLRVLAGVLISPVIVLTLFGARALIACTGASSDIVVWTLLTVYYWLPVMCGGMILLGVPTILWLVHRDHDRVWHYALAGIACGIATQSIRTFAVALSGSFCGVFGRGILDGAIHGLLLPGGLGGATWIVFWAMVIRRHRKPG